MLPAYQGIPSSQLKFKRMLMGGFPCYTQSSPLTPAFDRVLQIGDASAAQSPLSFGGFGSMVRHLPRLARGIEQALNEDKLQRPSLAWLQPYQPSLRVAWLFQRSMSVGVGQLKRWMPKDQINRLLRCNFAVMRILGDTVLRPFVQDAMQVGPLAATMLGMMVRDPVAVTRVLFQLGPVVILKWFGHFFALLAATVVFQLLRPLRSVVKAYAFQRLLDALEYGSALDYKYHATASTVGHGGANGLGEEMRGNVHDGTVTANGAVVVEQYAS